MTKLNDLFYEEDGEDTQRLFLGNYCGSNNGNSCGDKDKEDCIGKRFGHLDISKYIESIEEAKMKEGFKVLGHEFKGKEIYIIVKNDEEVPHYTSDRGRY